MALKAIGLFVLSAWAAMTVVQIEAWQSNRALWTREVSVHPTLSRPLINLAIERRKDGAMEDAIRLVVLAGQHADQSPHPDDMHHRVRAQLLWLETFYDPTVCQRPDVQPYCY